MEPAQKSTRLPAWYLVGLGQSEEVFQVKRLPGVRPCEQVGQSELFHVKHPPPTSHLNRLGPTFRRELGRVGTKRQCGRTETELTCACRSKVGVPFHAICPGPETDGTWPKGASQALRASGTFPLALGASKPASPRLRPIHECKDAPSTGKRRGAGPPAPSLSLTRRSFNASANQLAHGPPPTASA